MAVKGITITVLLDNEVFLPGLMADWGLSLYLEVREGPRVLMDTGGSFTKLIRNAEALGVDLTTLDAIFISHWHGDHCGALPELLSFLGRPIEVLVPRRPGWTMAKRLARAGAKLVEAPRPLEFSPGLRSTGDMGGEHSLVIDVGGLGLLILTGCSHPGPKAVVQRAVEVLGRPAYGLMGGLHISSYHEGLELGAFLTRAGVQFLCPCHCTGSMAKRGLQEAFGGQLIRCGVGKRILLDRGGLKSP